MAWRVDTWTAVKPPSIYHAVKQLDREGLLNGSGRQESPHGPARVEYRLTAAGEDEFFRLLETALVSPDIEEFGAGIAFMQCLPRRRVVELLTQQRATTERIDDELNAMKPLWPDPEAPPHAKHLLDLWRGLFQSNARWAGAMLVRLSTGEFRFADE
jgi:DNA-binding PadR family transcriptional regulator